MAKSARAEMWNGWSTRTSGLLLFEVQYFIFSLNPPRGINRRTPMPETVPDVNTTQFENSIRRIRPNPGSGKPGVSRARPELS